MERLQTDLAQPREMRELVGMACQVWHVRTVKLPPRYRHKHGIVNQQVPVLHDSPEVRIVSVTPDKRERRIMVLRVLIGHWNEHPP